MATIRKIGYATDLLTTSASKDKASKFLGLVATATVLATSNVAAEEETLKFRLVTRMISGTVIDASNVEGQSVGAGKYAGVAVFEDGRLANKEFVLSMDNRGAEGTYTGHNAYNLYKRRFPDP